VVWTNPDAHDKLEMKGIQVVRRDSCPLVRLASTEVLDAIMFRRDAQLALGVARGHLAALLRGEVPFEQLVLSKALRGGYKNELQPHLLVARKVAARRGYAVPSGERVAFVYVKNPGAQSLSEKAEDPQFAAEHALPADALHYLEHQLLEPLCGLLKPLVEGDAREALLGSEARAASSRCSQSPG